CVGTGLNWGGQSLGKTTLAYLRRFVYNRFCLRSKLRLQFAHWSLPRSMIFRKSMPKSRRRGSSFRRSLIAVKTSERTEGEALTANKIGCKQTDEGMPKWSYRDFAHPNSNPSLR